MSLAPPHRRSHSSSTPALNWLDHDPKGTRLLQTARTLLSLEAALAQTLPPSLATRIRVARMDGHELCVMVPGPAHASRLRQMAPGIARALGTAGWPVERIVVRIDAALERTWTEKPRREAEPLGENALKAFESLGANVSPGPLADAIARLLRHHRSP